MSRQEGQIDLKIVIGQSVHVMGYVEKDTSSVEKDTSSQELVVRAIMIWNAGNLIEKDKIAYVDTVSRRIKQKQQS